MTRRQLVLVFGILAALSAVWISMRDRESPVAESLDLGAMIERDVSAIRIKPADTSAIRLQLVKDRWTVNGYPANDSLVESLLGQLDTLPPARIIARNSATHGRLGVDAATAIRVEFGPEASPGAVFLLGGSGPEGRFIRLPDQSEVFVVPGTALQDLDLEEYRWRDRTIVTVDTAALSRFVIRRGSNLPVTATRDGTQRWFVDGTPIDTTVMRLWLETVADLQAIGFPADSFVYAVDFDRPDAVLDLYVGVDPADTPSASLLFASIPTRVDVLVRRANDPIVYAIDARRANLLTASRNRFINGF